VRPEALLLGDLPCVLAPSVLIDPPLLLTHPKLLLLKKLRLLLVVESRMKRGLSEANACLGNP
jgi:hypothetical protein